MSLNTDIRIWGAKELDELLRDLPGGVRRKVLRAAISAAASPVNKAAKSFAPTETKALKKAIGTKVMTMRDGTVIAIVGVRRGTQFTILDRHGRKRVPAFYQHLVHGGVRAHKISGRGKRLLSFTDSQGENVITKSVSHPGQTANPFLRKAWNSQRSRVESIILSVSRQRTAIELQKLASKTRRK